MNEPIRVAHVIGNWLGGGVESVVMNYYRNIDRNKVQFDFLCSESSTDIPYEEIEKLGGRVFIVPNYTKVVKYQKELQKIFKENNYKIVHSHISTMSVFPLRAAKKAGVPIRIAHSHSTTNKKEKKKNLLKQVLRPFSRVYATDYMCCSELAGRWLFGNKEYDKGNVYLLNNAIDLDKFKFDEDVRLKTRKKLNICNDEIIFGHVGRFVPTKNQKFVLEVFNKFHKKNKKSKLIYVGKGPDLESVKFLVQKYHLTDSVIFMGQCSNIFEIYQAMDVFLFPSLYEGLGMVLIEAQASNLPCIVSNNVPIEAKINDNVYFENIDIGSQNWLDTVENIIEYLNSRTSIKKLLSEKGYNIEIEAKKLQKKYFELIELGGNNGKS